MSDATCELCGDCYAVRDGCDPTPFCDECAHIEVANRFTLDEIMTVLSAAFPSPRTSRDCVIEANLRKALAHRTQGVSESPYVAPDGVNGG